MSQRELSPRQFAASVVPRKRQIPGQQALPGMDEHEERLAAITKRVPADDPYRTDLISAYVHGGLPTPTLHHLPNWIVSRDPEHMVPGATAQYSPPDYETGSPRHIAFSRKYLASNPDTLYTTATHEAAHALDTDIAGWGKGLTYSGDVKARAEGMATGVELRHRQDEADRYGVSYDALSTNGYEREPHQHFGLSVKRFHTSRQQAFEEAGGAPQPVTAPQVRGQIPIWPMAM